MPFRLKISLALFIAILLSLLLIPLFVPIPALQNTVSERGLADADSQFIEVGEVTLHYKESSRTPPENSPTFILLHGFGAHSFTWHDVMDELGVYGRVIAFDRPAFGLTERLMRAEWQENPYTPKAQVNLTLGLMDNLGIEKAILVGHSAGGVVATQLALEHPEHVEGLVLVSASILQKGGAPAWAKPLLYTPQLSRLGPLIMRQVAGEPGLNFIKSSWNNPEAIPEATIQGYQKPLRANNWDKALWEYSRANRWTNLEPDLPKLQIPTLVISGAGDSIIPPTQSEQISRLIPNSQFVLFDSCGHVPQEECPVPFVETIAEWLNGGQGSGIGGQ
jgi:pimeloyl-ACP methyl ester carboxylesterase